MTVPVERSLTSDDIELVAAQPTTHIAIIMEIQCIVRLIGSNGTKSRAKICAYSVIKDMKIFMKYTLQYIIKLISRMNSI